MAGEPFDDQRTAAVAILAPGAVIARYKLTSRLGAGGMGEVYLADDLQLKRRVALKFLSPNLATDDNLRLRFIREAQSAAALNHPNIITVYEVGEHSGRVFIAMEYVEGRTLREIIDSGQLTPEQALHLMLQICDGLQAAHIAGYVHRDIKPLNIVVGTDGRVRILDFGLAKVVGDSQLTQAGSALGTFQYMSPEQGQGIEADHRSDIFSLGVVLYEMLTSKLPFQKIGIPATMYAIVHEAPPPLSAHKPDSPPEHQAIVDRAMAKPVDSRYQSAAELAADVRRCLGLGNTAIPVATASFIVPPKPQTTSLAVLYLRNIGPADDDFLSYGITEDLIVDLSRIGSIRVAPMRSIMKYKDSDDELADIAAKLNVSHVLDGSIHKSVRAIRVSAQLVEAKEGKVLWAERWEEPPARLPNIKRALAEGISAALNIGATVVRRAEVAVPEAENAQAYEQYLKGKFLFERKQEKSDVVSALEWYRKALRQEEGLLAARVGVVEVLIYQGAYEEARSELTTALKEAESRNQRSEQAHLLRLNAKLLIMHSDWDAAWQIGTRALELTRELGDLSGEAETLGILISILQPQAKFDEALQLFDRVLEISRRLDDKDKIAEALKNMGVAYSRKGDYSRALDLYEEALEVAKSAENHSMQAACLSNIGNVYYFKGNLDSAVEHYGEALTINSRLGDQAGIARQSLNLGLVQLQRASFQEGLELLSNAADFFEALGDKANLSLALSNVAQCRLTLGAPDQALSAAERALALAQEAKHPLAESAANHRIGTIYLYQREHQQASDHLHRALEIAQSSEMNRNVAALEAELAGLHLSAGELGHSRKHAERSQALAREIEDRSTLCLAVAYQGVLSARGGLFHAGTNSVRQQAAKAQETGDMRLVLQIQILLGELLLGLGKDEDREEGKAVLIEALDQSRKLGLAPEIRSVETILEATSSRD